MLAMFTSFGPIQYISIVLLIVLVVIYVVLKKKGKA